MTEDMGMVPFHGPSIVPLKAETLHQMDGGNFGRLINRQLRLLEQDIEDRPVNASGKSEPRKLVIEIIMHPEAKFLDGQGFVLQRVWMAGTVAPKLPKGVSNPHHINFQNGMGHFNEDSPHSFYQRSLFDEQSHLESETEDDET